MAESVCFLFVIKTLCLQESNFDIFLQTVWTQVRADKMSGSDLTESKLFDSNGIPDFFLEKVDFEKNQQTT